MLPRLGWIVRHPKLVPVLAVVLCAPALLGGHELDDLFFALHADEPGFIGSAFTFFGEGPRPAHVGAADLPWWTQPGMRLDLLRPLAAATHLLDHRLWPNAGWAMHLHSLFWYGLLLALLHRAYRAFGGEPRGAVLAALVFGLSQAHAMNVGWVAARNSLMGAVLVLVVLLLHRKWRCEGWTAGSVLAPLAFAAALLCNEGTVASVGYLAAFALLLDQGRHRFTALLPYVAIVIAWRAFYGDAGYGAAATGIYLEPLADPVAYVGRTMVHATAMLAARLGIAVLDGLGAVPGGYSMAFVAGLPFVAGLGWLLRKRLRTDRTLAMWGLGTVLACGTAGTSVPTDRGLLILGIGGCVLIAELLLWTRREGASRGERIVGRVLLVMHLVISPLIMPLRVMTTPMLQSRIDEISAAFPDEPGVQQRTVILLNAPSDLVMFYSRAQAQLQGRGFPGRVSYLYAGTGGLDVKSIEPHVLEVTADRPWLATPLDRMFRADATFEQGQSIQAPCLTASILEVDEQELPRRIRFEVHAQREGCSPIYMAWTGKVPQLVELPEPGASMRLDPVSLP